jgi:hypothetical protein
LLQILLYQGMIFMQADFVFYHLIPAIFPGGKNPHPELGRFS